jgi:hypothetical protein
MKRRNDGLADGGGDAVTSDPLSQHIQLTQLAERNVLSATSRGISLPDRAIVAASDSWIGTSDEGGA